MVYLYNWHHLVEKDNTEDWVEDSSYSDPLEKGEQLKEWVDQIFRPFCLEFKPVLPDVLIRSP